MKEGWIVKKLGEVCNTSSGGTPSKSHSEYYDGGTIPWLRSGEISKGNIYETELFITEEGLKKSSAKIFPINTVVIAMYGATVGQVGILKKEMSTNQAVCGIYPNDVFSPDFLAYVLKNKKEKFILLASGGAQPNISQTIINQTYIPVPPLSEQSRIVEELDLLSNIIEKKRQQLSELDNLAQSIFYDMFGDPVTNEKGWEVKTIGDIVLSVNYGTSSPASEDGKYKYLRMNNLTYSGFLDLKDLKTITIGEKEYEKYVVRKGDILFNRTNSKDLVGKTALFDLDEEMIIAGYIIRVRTNSQMVLPIYVVKHMNTPYIKQYLANLCKGAVNQANINTKELQKIPICIPPLSLQQLFAQKIEAIQKQKELIKQSIAETEELFNSRMDYYFN